MESEEGTAFEFLPRRKPCRNTADQPFLLNLESAFVSLVLQVCALTSQGKTKARKVGKRASADGSVIFGEHPTTALQVTDRLGRTLQLPATL
jgi:hypothetical protein